MRLYKEKPLSKNLTNQTTLTIQLKFYKKLNPLVEFYVELLTKLLIALYKAPYKAPRKALIAKEIKYRVKL